MSCVEVIELYKKELERYSLDQLTFKAEPGVWSIGQLYVHLIEDTHYYLDRVEQCTSAYEEIGEGKTEAGERLFASGSFPPIKLQSPGTPVNPRSADDLRRGLDQVLDRMREWNGAKHAINLNGKERHDGFGWLNAQEWFELIGMHFRHHLRQKAELEQRLGG